MSSSTFRSRGSVPSRHGWTAGQVIPAFTRFHAGDTPPSAGEYDALIIMGGPMSVNDGGRYPWLAAETRAIADAVSAGRRVLGICLGAQLIAHALECRVFPSDVKEIGWSAVHRVGGAAGPLAALPGRTLVFQWHGETFDLPAGAVNHFASDACTHQAFQLGESVLALQFHLETTREGARSLIANCPGDLAAGPGVQGAGEIVSSARPFTESNRLMDAVLDAHLLRTSS